MARQRLGQHFLADQNWRQRIFETLPRNSPETWLEIGAGHGEMTQLLASTGSRVVAIETDAPLIDGLREKFRSDANTFAHAEVIPADILALDLAQIAPNAKLRVYGNLPYYITSPILHRLFQIADRLLSIHIVIQLEVAQRITARPGTRAYGYLSVACQFYTHPEIFFKIPPGAFRPPPKVTSALVRMDVPGRRASLEIPDEAEGAFLNFVQGCFGQKRKTLRNNLLANYSETAIQQSLANCGLRPDARAEQLSLSQFAKLFSSLNVPVSYAAPVSKTKD